MNTDIIRNALSVPSGTRENTTQLVASLGSFRQTQDALQKLVQQIRSEPPEVQQKLAPIISGSITPLQGATNSVISKLEIIVSLIRNFCDDVANESKELGQDYSHLPPFLKKFRIQTFLKQSSASSGDIVSACHSAGSRLTDYRNNVNSTIGHLNTYAEQLQQENEQLEDNAEKIQQKFKHMSDEPWYDKIADGFKVLFGHLKQDLEKDMVQMKKEEFIIEINKSTIGALDQITKDMSNISDVVSALGVSWRNLGDSVNDLEQDISTVTANISASDMKSDLEYINSDWQNVMQIPG
jgi:prefoldin subunit 5